VGQVWNGLRKEAGLFEVQAGFKLELQNKDGELVNAYSYL
jgi:hypothetical protein